MRNAVKVFVFGFLLFLGCGKANKTESRGSEDLISKILLVDLEGNSVNLSSYKGKAVFINFWATWCKPCIMEMPTLVRAQEKFKNENIIFFFASDEEPEQIMKFQDKHSYNFNYVRVKNLEELNIQALPTTYIFNPAGKLEFSEAGYRTWDATDNIEMISKIINRE
jgi:thiol-disulfide isomerase/thioredoxin